MNQRPIGFQSATLLIVALCAIIAALVRRDQLTRQLLIRTINDVLDEGGRHD